MVFDAKMGKNQKLFEIIVNQPCHQKARTFFHWQYDYICRQKIFLHSNKLNHI